MIFPRVEGWLGVLTNRVARPPTVTTVYWLIENPGAGGSEVFTVRADAGREALPVFSFPDEAEMFLRLGCLEEKGWRTVESTAGELVSQLAKLHRAGVGLVALDPLPEMVGPTLGMTISLVTLSLRDFAGRHAIMPEEELARN